MRRRRCSNNKKPILRKWGIDFGSKRIPKSILGIHQNRYLFDPVPQRMFWDVLWLTFRSLLAPFGSLLVSFGSFQIAFNSPWITFGALGLTCAHPGARFSYSWGLHASFVIFWYISNENIIQYLTLFSTCSLKIILLTFCS